VQGASVGWVGIAGPVTVARAASLIFAAFAMLAQQWAQCIKQSAQ
jgi:hypothetical protein